MHLLIYIIFESKADFLHCYICRFIWTDDAGVAHGNLPTTVSVSLVFTV